MRKSFIRSQRDEGPFIMAQTTRPPRRPAGSRTLPAQEISREVLLEKYAKGDETTASQVRARVAHALAMAEPDARRAHWEARFLEAQENGFIPAGRINSAAGTSLTALRRVSRARTRVIVSETSWP